MFAVDFRRFGASFNYWLLDFAILGQHPNKSFLVLLIG